MAAALSREGVNDSGAAVVSRPDTVPPRGNPGCVLVAANDPDLRERVSQPLLERGFDVAEAADASDALKLARNVAVDVAIIDVDGVGIGTSELLRRWSSDDNLGGYVPVLLIAARPEADDVAAGIHVGAHDYILPPFDDLEVLARVYSALAAKRGRDDLVHRVFELQQLVGTDALTGLYNRRHMEAELAALASAARRQQTPLGVLLVDVDRFKRINDRVSHETGDTALRTVAHRLRRTVRAEDVVGRWGGDEFMVLLPSTDRDAALVLAERLRREIARPGGDARAAVALTVSVGCAASHAPEDLALVGAADAALHRAKAGGRNRVSG